MKRKAINISLFPFAVNFQMHQLDKIAKKIVNKQLTNNDFQKKV